MGTKALTGALMIIAAMRKEKEASARIRGRCRGCCLLLLCIVLAVLDLRIELKQGREVGHTFLCRRGAETRS